MTGRCMRCGQTSAEPCEIPSCDRPLWLKPLADLTPEDLTYCPHRYLVAIDGRPTDMGCPVCADSTSGSAVTRLADDAPTRRLVFTPASRVRMKPVRWAWDTSDPTTGTHQEGRFPANSLVIAAGRAGLGKSQFAVWMAAQITRGDLPGILYGTPRTVVYAAAEDSWAMTIAPRLVAAGADLDMVFRIDVTDDGDPHATLTLPSDTSLLERGLTERSVALVVLDPLLSMIDHGINDYRAREVRQALEPLVNVADRTGALMLGLAHFNKSTGSDPLTLISGSGAFGQLVRAAVGFARDDEDGTLILSQIKNNLGREDLPSLTYAIEPATVDTDEGPSGVSRFQLTGTSDRDVRDVLRDRSRDGEDDGKLKRTVDHILATLDAKDASHCMATKDLQEEVQQVLGVSKRTFDSARQSLCLAAHRHDKNWFVRLPDKDCDLAKVATVQTHNHTSQPCNLGDDDATILPFQPGDPA